MSEAAGDSRTLLVTGASRGLGLEWVRQHADLGWRVLATCRRPDAASELRALAERHPAVEVLPLDVTDSAAIEALAARLADEPIDWLVSNAGVYGRKGLPLAEVDKREWLAVLEVNAIAPLELGRAFLPQLERGRGRTVAMITSKVGSVADNRAGGNFAYRTSKAALNQVVKTLAIGLAERDIRVVALHPGWVRTDMGGPGALIEPETSVAGMRRVLEGLGPEDSGRFLTFEGDEVPW